MFGSSLKRQPRLSTEAGIAIGPILFVVAILGILAAAIAAGSGSFTGSSATEGARTKAAALIQIGQNLKVGADRLVGLGYDADTINISPTSTSLDNDLFSPSGGGVGVPSVTMANAPTTDVWRYTHLAITNMGTTATELVAFLPVALTSCDQVNVKANGISATAASTGSLAADVGNLANDPSGGLAWPTGLAAKPTGCLKATGTSTGYQYYQVLVIR
jgi:type II secretory pathway pseudopilin PulG